VLKPAENAKQSNLNVIEQENLPHLYGYPWYKWAKEFFESTNKQNFLCAANQISKSSTMIRKCIHWATDKSLWPKLWKTSPNQFWYFYPNKDTATREFNEKWVKEFLPKDKECPIYGWKVFFQYGQIHRVEFNSNVTIYFFSYEQKFTNIQSSSVHAMFCDEEAPVGVYHEVTPRLWATGGYFHMVFTATIGQEEWRLTIEETGEREKFKDAFKRQVSMYDCVTYEDGSPSPWTFEKVKAIEDSCLTEAERLRRVYGKFILSEGRTYTFDDTKHTLRRQGGAIGWYVFAGVYENAIVLVKVSPKFDRAEVISGWCPQEDETDVSALSTYIKYRSLTQKIPVSHSYADKKMSKDFIKVALSGGSGFQETRKPKDNGAKLINSLFESGILKIVDKKPLYPLITQMKNARKKDEDIEGLDMLGAFITAVTNIPWNFATILNPNKPKKDPYEGLSERERFYRGLDRPLETTDTYDKEIQEINEDYYDESSF
jgi:phage terminase large subunit-like protein